MWKGRGVIQPYRGILLLAAVGLVIAVVFALAGAYAP
jgi:hypothetical protein